jgi:predicted DNA-binding transcriptional regulator AlpA
VLVSPQVSPNCLVVHRACHWKSPSIKRKIVHVSQPADTNNDRWRNANGANTTMCSLQKISEAQEELGVSRSSVYRLIRECQLDVVYVLSSPRITRASIDSYIERNLVTKELAR